jgi:zinc protease
MRFGKVSHILLASLIGLSGAAQTAAPAKPQASKSASAASSAPETVAPKRAASAAAKEDLAAADLRTIAKPPLPAFHPQQPKRIQFDNGMVIFLQEDHELPLIDAAIRIRGGSKSEPEAKTGLVSIYTGAWRTGGSKTRTGDQLDDLLESRAAQIETSGGTVVSTFLSLSCLKGDFDFVLDLANDLLRNPEFRQDKIDLAKDGLRAGIARRNDNLGQIAGREATKIGFGARSPYARVPEYATLAAVTRQDLLDWHDRYVHPNNIILSVSGDFDDTEMESKLRKLFAGWPKGPSTPVSDVPVPAPAAGTYFVAKEDVNQSEVRLVAPGIRRDDPDYYAVSVMNEILGGGFASRLFLDLRTKAGLAYAVGGGVGAAFDHPALTTLSIGTKSGTTAKAIEGLFHEIEQLRSQGVTQAEVDRGKDAILNSFVFEYDSKVKVMNERSNYEFYGYPPDFLERYQQGVQKVSVADVDRVAKKYLDKGRFSVLVVGKAADFDKPLNSFGSVTTVDVTIPQPGSAAGAAVAGNPEGKALLAKVFEGAGGLDKLKAIKTVHTKARQTVSPQGLTLDIDAVTMGADNIQLKVNTPNGELTMVATGQSGFMSMAAMGTRDIPSSQREGMLKNLRREVWFVAQHSDDPLFSFAAQGTEKIGEVDAAILDISGGGDLLRWFVDAKTGRILRASYQGETPNGPAAQVTDYSDWKSVNGINVPFHEEISSNGQPSGAVTLSNVEFNPAVDPKIFEKQK